MTYDYVLAVSVPNFIGRVDLKIFLRYGSLVTNYLMGSQIEESAR